MTAMPVTSRNAGTIRMSIPLRAAAMSTHALRGYCPGIRCRMSRSASGQKWSIITSANTR